jgi:hypothetical protein
LAFTKKKKKKKKKQKKKLNVGRGPSERKSEKAVIDSLFFLLLSAFSFLLSLLSTPQCSSALLE